MNLKRHFKTTAVFKRSHAHSANAQPHPGQNPFDTESA